MSYLGINRFKQTDEVYSVITRYHSNLRPSWNGHSWYLTNRVEAARVRRGTAPEVGDGRLVSGSARQRTSAKVWSSSDRRRRGGDNPYTPPGPPSAPERCSNRWRSGRIEIRRRWPVMTLSGLSWRRSGDAQLTSFSCCRFQSSRLWTIIRWRLTRYWRRDDTPTSYRQVSLESTCSFLSRSLVATSSGLSCTCQRPRRQWCHWNPVNITAIIETKTM